MASVKDLFVDLQNAAFVKSTTDSSDFSWPQIFHADNLNLAIRFLRANTGGLPTAPYTLIDISAASLTVKVWDPTGQTLYAAQATWSADNVNKILSGQLNLNTVTMQTALTNALSVPTTFEFSLLLSDGNYTVQESVTVYKSFNVSGSPTPTPGAHYITLEEANGIFAKFSNLAGQTITLMSPDGTKQLVLGVDNTGAALGNPQQ